MATLQIYRRPGPPPEVLFGLPGQWTVLVGINPTGDVNWSFRRDGGNEASLTDVGGGIVWANGRLTAAPGDFERDRQRFKAFLDSVGLTFGMIEAELRALTGYRGAPTGPERWVWSGGALRREHTGEVVIGSSAQDSWVVTRDQRTRRLIAAAPVMLEHLRAIHDGRQPPSIAFNLELGELIDLIDGQPEGRLGADVGSTDATAEVSVDVATGRIVSLSNAATEPSHPISGRVLYLIDNQYMVREADGTERPADIDDGPWIASLRQPSFSIGQGVADAFDGQPYAINPNHPIAQLEANGGALPNVPGEPLTPEALERAIIQLESQAIKEMLGPLSMPSQPLPNFLSAEMNERIAAVKFTVGDVGSSIRACECFPYGVFHSSARADCSKLGCTCNCHPENR